MADARSRRNEPEQADLTRSRQWGTNGAAIQGIENRGKPKRRRPLSLSTDLVNKSGTNRLVTDVAGGIGRCSRGFVADPRLMASASPNTYAMHRIMARNGILLRWMGSHDATALWSG